MSLETRLIELGTAVADKIKPLQNAQGNLSALTTTEKTSLVGAINELVTTIGSLSGGGAAILDTAGDGDVTHTWSADKIYDELQALKSSLLDGGDPAFDTLQELASALGDNDSAISGLLTSVGNRVRYDAAQALTAEQQLQACQNIGIGDPDVDLAALFEAQFP